MKTQLSLKKSSLIVTSIFAAIFIGSLLMPKNAHAIDLINEGYGWARNSVSSAGPNRARVVTRDASTGAPIQMDSMFLILQDNLGGGWWSTYTCNGNCPANGIYEFSGIPEGFWSLAFVSGAKTGYHAQYGQSTLGVQFNTALGQRFATQDVYFTTDATQANFRINFPVQGVWYSYDPGYSVTLMPSFGASTAHVLLHINGSTFSQILDGPFGGAFPQTRPYGPQGLSDGPKFINGSFYVDNTNAVGYFSRAMAFGVDRQRPTANCSAPVLSGSQLSVTLSSNDPGGNLASGVVEGDLQMRTSLNGGGNWTNYATVSNQVAGSFNQPIAPGTSYQFQFRARDRSIDPSGAANHWSGYTPCGTYIAPASDFTVSVTISPPGSVAQGGRISALVTITPIGVFNSDVALQPPVNVPGGSGITYDPFIPAVVNASNGWRASFVINTSLTTVPGNYLISVTGVAAGLPPRSGSDILTVTLRPIDPWLLTRGGNVGSQGGIEMLGNPPANSFNSSHMVFASRAIDNFSSAKSWLLGNYANYAGAVSVNYSNLFAQFGANACAYASGGALPDNFGRWRISGSFTVNGGLQGGVASCGGGSSRNGRVIFVDGDLTVSSDLNYNRTTVFIVRGSVTVAANVTNVNAFIMADGGFTDSSGNTRLTINGGLMTSLGGGGSQAFLRDLGSAGNATQASEEIILNPKVYYVLAEYLGDSTLSYTEVAP